MKEKIKIEYDGKFPNLCSGRLQVWVGNNYYDFGRNILISGGHVCKNENWDMWSETGPWRIDEDDIPEEFPKEYLIDLLNEINCTLPWGCCGGCI